MTNKPTPEEIEAARLLVAQADAESQREARQAALDAVQPLIDVGFGGDEIIEATMAEVIAAIRAQIQSPTATRDMALLNLYTATANCLTTLNDRVRSIVAQNQPPPESPSAA